MAIATLGAEYSTVNLSVPINTFFNLLPQMTVTGTGNVVEIVAYCENLDPNQTQIQIVIDGNATPLFLTTPDQVILRDTVLNTGSHTIDFQAYSFISGQTAMNRALTAVNLA